LLEFFATDGFTLKLKKCEVADEHARPLQRNAHDREKRNQKHQSQHQAHENAAKNKPQKIANGAHDCFSMTADVAVKKYLF
jgi:hypothetical protein